MTPEPKKRKPAMEPVTDLTEITDPRIGIEDPELAQIVWYALSRFVGEITGWRRWAYEVCAALAGIGRLEMRLKGAGHGASVLEAAPFPDVPVRGWPGTQNVMRRLGLRPRELDGRWSCAVDLDEEYATLPLDLLAQIFPPPIWAVVGLAIEWGPYELNRRLERWLRLAARGEAPGGIHRAPDSLVPAQSALRHLMRQLKWLAEKDVPFQLLEQWRAIPDAIAIDSKWAGDKPKRSRPRVAPTLEPVRLARDSIEREIVRLEQTKKGRQGLRAPLRDRSLLDLCAVTAGRIEPIQLMTVADFRWDYLCEDGVRRPAILMKELKGQRWIARWKPIPEECAERLQRYIDYLGIADQPDQTLWPGRWLYYDVDSGAPMTSGEASRRPSRAVRRPSARAQTPEELSRHVTRLLAPFVAGRVSAHLLRRFGQKMAKEAARRYLDAHPETEAYVTQSVIAKCLLDHTFGSVSARYEELKREEFREKWARIAITGIWDYYAGDLGAKKGLDRDRILVARQRHAEALSDLNACRAALDGVDSEQIEFEEGRHRLQKDMAETVARHDRKLERLRNRRRAAVASALRDPTASELEWRRHELALRELDDEIDAARERSRREERAAREAIDAERNRLDRLHREGAAELRRLEASVRAREAEFDDACAARVPVPEGVEIDPEAELEELLGATSIARLETGTADAGGSSAPQRDWLAPSEYAEAVGIPPSSLNRHIKIALASSTGFAFPVGDRRNSWFQPIGEILEVRGERSRRFIFSRLDLSKYHPDQIARMKEILATPRTALRDEPSGEAQALGGPDSLAA